MTLFHRILVDVDAAASAQPALDQAARIARETGATLRIVDVVAPGGSPSERSSDMRRSRLQRLSECVSGLKVDTELLTGPRASALIAEVRRHGHDLIVRSHAQDRAADDATADARVAVDLLQSSPCSLWAVGLGAVPATPRIACAVDLAPADFEKQVVNRRVLDVAIALGDMFGGILSVVHAWHPPFEDMVRSHSTDGELAVYLERARSRAQRVLNDFVEAHATNRKVSRVLLQGSAEEAVPPFTVSDGTDLLVLGAGRRPAVVRRFFRGTAERLLSRITCSVLAVRHAPLK